MREIILIDGREMEIIAETQTFRIHYDDETKRAVKINRQKGEQKITRANLPHHIADEILFIYKTMINEDYNQNWKHSDEAYIRQLFKLGLNKYGSW